uniref:Uncharacterized protein n=1 Tax=Romanomermis culicivorax TaxID=13658 RepID=A0A915I762_ROMCU
MNMKSPQEINESLDESGLPPVIVPLEVAAYQGECNNVQRRERDHSYGRINWKAISKTVCSNSDANPKYTILTNQFSLMSNTEKAIISGKHLIENAAASSTLSTNFNIRSLSGSKIKYI